MNERQCQLIKLVGSDKIYCIGLDSNAHGEPLKEQEKESIEYLRLINDFLSFNKSASYSDIKKTYDASIGIGYRIFENFYERMRLDFSLKNSNILNIGDTVVIKKNFIEDSETLTIKDDNIIRAILSYPNINLFIHEKNLYYCDIYNSRNIYCTTKFNSKSISYSITNEALLIFNESELSKEIKNLEKRQIYNLEKKIKDCKNKDEAVNFINKIYNSEYLPKNFFQKLYFKKQNTNNLLLNIGLEKLIQKFNTESSIYNNQIDCETASKILTYFTDEKFSHNKVRSWFKSGKFSGNKTYCIFIDIEDILNYISEKNNIILFSPIQLLELIKSKKTKR